MKVISKQDISSFDLERSQAPRQVRTMIILFFASPGAYARNRAFLYRRVETVLLLDETDDQDYLQNTQESEDVSLDGSSFVTADHLHSQSSIGSTVAESPGKKDSESAFAASVMSIMSGYLSSIVKPEYLQKEDFFVTADHNVVLEKYREAAERLVELREQRRECQLEGIEAPRQKFYEEIPIERNACCRVKNGMRKLDKRLRGMGRRGVLEYEGVNNATVTLLSIPSASNKNSFHTSWRKFLPDLISAVIPRVAGDEDADASEELTHPEGFGKYNEQSVEQEHQRAKVDALRAKAIPTMYRKSVVLGVFEAMTRDSSVVAAAAQVKEDHSRPARASRTVQEEMQMQRNNKRQSVLEGYDFDSEQEYVPRVDRVRKRLRVQLEDEDEQQEL